MCVLPILVGQPFLVDKQKNGGRIKNNTTAFAALDN